MTRFRKQLAAILRDTQAVALTEFALSAPILLIAGLYGLETANLTITHMRVSQAAMHVADNASRIGDTSTLSDRKIYESDIIDLMVGSDIQAGRSIDLYEHGRVIISSLETDPDDAGQQYIHWQRCKGKKTWPSSYGVTGDGLGNPLFLGMGPAGEEVMAMEDEAVMFVEVAYDYQPIFSDAFIGDPVIKAYSAFTVRADRDLAEVYQRDPDNPDEVASCAKHDGINTISG